MMWERADGARENLPGLLKYLGDTDVPIRPIGAETGICHGDCPRYSALCLSGNVKVEPGVSGASFRRLQKRRVREVPTRLSSVRASSDAFGPSTIQRNSRKREGSFVLTAVSGLKSEQSR